MTADYDILIVGAGMVGAALACSLASSGARIGVLERELPAEFDPHALPDIRVSAISAGSQKLLARLGAWHRVQAMRTCPYRRLAVWEQLKNPLTGARLESRLNRTEFNCTELRQPYLGHIVENRVLQQALLAEMAQRRNIELISPVQLQSMSLPNTPEELTQLHLADGRSLSAPLVVGADGALSRIRQWAQIGEYADTYAQQALVASVRIQGSQQDITWQAFTPTGPLAFLPLPSIDGQSYASLVWYQARETVPARLAMNEAEFLAEIRRHFPTELPPMDALLERASFPLVKRHALHYGRRGVALVGDAAHTINPLAGQGVNLGFQDVEALAKRLLEARRQQRPWNDVELLHAYEQERRSANQLMMNLMDLFYYGFSNELAPIKLLRNLGLSAASRFKPGQRWVMEYAMGLKSASELPLPFLQTLKLNLPSLPRLF